MPRQIQGAAIDRWEQKEQRAGPRAVYFSRDGRSRDGVTQLTPAPVIRQPIRSAPMRGFYHAIKDAGRRSIFSSNIDAKGSQGLLLADAGTAILV